MTSSLLKVSLRGSGCPKLGLLMLGPDVYTSPGMAPDSGCVGVVFSLWLVCVPPGAAASTGEMYPSMSGGICSGFELY